jgi:hypothetical protein
MIILWIRKNKGDKHNLLEKNDSQTFEEHDDVMKRFRLAHPDLAIESPRDIFSEDGLMLHPIQPIELWENIQN